MQGLSVAYHRTLAALLLLDATPWNLGLTPLTLCQLLPAPLWLRLLQHLHMCLRKQLNPAQTMPEFIAPH